MKDMIKDAIILFFITLIAGLALGYVNFITKAPIEEAQLKAKISSYQEVFKDAESFSESIPVSNIVNSGEWESLGFKGISVDEIVEAKDAGGNSLGYVLLINTSNGYGGDISFSMGITSDGVLNGISLLSISETAGLGMRAGEVLVPQFKAKSVSSFEVTKQGAVSDSQIDAISGATITSKAVTQAVNAGLYYKQNILGGAY